MCIARRASKFLQHGLEYDPDRNIRDMNYIQWLSNLMTLLMYYMHKHIGNRATNSDKNITISPRYELKCVLTEIVANISEEEKFSSYHVGNCVGTV